MSLLKFLLANWDSVFVVIAAIITVIVLVKRGETAFLKDILFRFVTKAEQEFGGGTGELKKAAVIELVYDKLPAVLRLIITRKDLDKMIDDVLVYAKTKWVANDKLNALVSNKIE